MLVPMVFHLDWFHCTIDLKIQGCVIGVYQHFQQFVIYNRDNQT
jgi:hypothetical protein